MPLTLPANDYYSWRDDTGAIHPLRGPIRVRLLVPADAREVHVASDVAALVRFRVPFHDAPEDDPQPPVMRAVGLSTDPAQRSADYRRLITFTEEQMAPWILLYQPAEAFAMRADIAWKIPRNVRPYQLTFRAGQISLGA